jgi:ribosomal protein L19
MNLSKYTNTLNKNYKKINIGNTVKINYYNSYIFNKKIQINAYTFIGTCIQYNKKTKNIILFSINNKIGIKQKFNLNSKNILKIQINNHTKATRAKLYNNMYRIK